MSESEESDILVVGPGGRQRKATKKDLMPAPPGWNANDRLTRQQRRHEMKDITQESTSKKRWKQANETISSTPRKTGKGAAKQSMERLLVDAMDDEAAEGDLDSNVANNDPVSRTSSILEVIVLSVERQSNLLGLDGHDSPGTPTRNLQPSKPQSIGKLRTSKTAALPSLAEMSDDSSLSSADSEALPYKLASRDTSGSTQTEAATNGLFKNTGASKTDSRPKKKATKTTKSQKNRARTAAATAARTAPKRGTYTYWRQNADLISDELYHYAVDDDDKPLSASARAEKRLLLLADAIKNKKCEIEAFRLHTKNKPAWTPTEIERSVGLKLEELRSFVSLHKYHAEGTGEKVGRLCERLVGKEEAMGYEPGDGQWFKVDYSMP